MTPGPSRPSPGASRLLPLLLVPIALLADPLAGLPLRTYFFRDFTATFYPLRLFAATELRGGRFPAWNPYLFEGSFALPSLYPLDLLHVAWPSPTFVSWLLTLHLPLAALAAWWLARELGATRSGALASGAVYALGGLALSSLNLYVFLQALALAPLVVATLRRAALRGGRATLVSAIVLALALSTLAVEFVGQAVLLGVALGAVARPNWRGGSRLTLATLLGVGLCALPLALTLGLLPETPRGAGFDQSVRLGNAVHPAVLLQTILPNLFGVPQAPAEAWWGGHFFSKGLPYFLTLYVGPTFLGLAWIGLGRLRPRERAVVVILAALGLWYSLGSAGGLANLVSELPLARSFRFPSKALLLPYLALSVGAGLGVDRLRFSPRSWPRLARALGVLAAGAIAVAVVVAAAPGGLVAWSGVRPAFWPELVGVASRDAALVTAMAAVVAVVATSVARGWTRTGVASALVVVVAVLDLARAGAGTNAQVSPAFFEPLPEMRALGLDALDGHRVFSYGLDHSPAFREFLGQGGPALTFTGTWLGRQILAPYSNVLDRVEVPEATDLTSFVPRSPELGTEYYDPGAIDGLVPWLRNASVSRVLSLDPLRSADLETLETVPIGPPAPGLAIRVYRLSDPWPREYVACRVLVAGDAETAARAVYAREFSPGTDVALEVEVPAACGTGTVSRRSFLPAERRYAVEADGAAHLVTRDSFARGWTATVDGAPARVLRANGKHMAVPVPAGRHDVRLRYRPPGWHKGLVGSALAVLLVALARTRARERPGPAH